MVKQAVITDPKIRSEVNHFLDDFFVGIDVDDNPRPIPDPETFVRNMARLYREGDIEEKGFADWEVEHFLAECCPHSIRQAYMDLYVHLKGFYRAK